MSITQLRVSNSFELVSIDLEEQSSSSSRKHDGTTFSYSEAGVIPLYCTGLKNQVYG